MPTTSELACSTVTKTLARPSRTVIVCVMSVPHISLALSVMTVPSVGLVSVRPTRCGASRPFWRITRRTRRGLARTPAKRDEPSFVVASGKLDECGSQLFDSVEGSHPQQVLFQSSDEARHRTPAQVRADQCSLDP